jgi:hypothetical protein
MRRRILALLAALLWAPALASAQGYSTLSPEGLRTGVLLRQAECPNRAGFAWVAAPHPDGVEEGVCIRYYAAGLDAGRRDAVIFLHGNRLAYVYDEAGRLIRIGASDGYGMPSEESLQRAAGLISGAIGRPFVILARPGNYGSSGIAADQYRRREILLVNAAVDAIKRRHGIETFGISAQSGGGPALAGMLELRSDIACAVFSSSLTAMSVLERERSVNRTSRAPFFSERLPELYDPIQEVAKIKPSDTRRIFVVSDSGDRSVSITAQQAYVEALRRQGLRVAATTSTAVGAQHHSLGATGQRAAGWCLDGLPDEEILAHMRRGEAGSILPGGFY